MILPQRELFDNSRIHPKNISAGRSDKFSGACRGIIPAMEVLYLDLWFCLNFLCDYLLCLVTARAAGLCLKRQRYMLAAMLGAIYACAAVLPGFAFLGKTAWKLTAGLLMSWIAFGEERRPLRCILLFFTVSASFGGALLALSGGQPIRLSLRSLLFAFLLCYGVGVLLFRCHALLSERETKTVAVELGGRRAQFSALRDTGNALRDPLTGSRVLIASPQALRTIFREDTALFAELDAIQLQTLSASVPLLAGKLRLLPYAAVGGRGLLPVFPPERVFIDGTESHDYLVAVSPQAFGDGFEAIL